MRKIVALLLSLFLVVSPVLAANSATDVEGTIDGKTYGHNYYKEIVQYAADQQRAKDCPAETHLQPKTETVIERLEKDSIFFFHGHCAPGKMGVKYDKIDPTDPTRWIYAKNGPHGEKTLDDLELSNLNFIFFDCCNSASSVDYHGNLVKIAVQRGARCAFGFSDDLQRADAAVVYGRAFWDAARKGNNWYESHFSGIVALKKDPVISHECDGYGRTLCGYLTMDFEPKKGDACYSYLQPKPETPETTSQPSGLETATITLEQARDIIREFTGNPNLKVKYDNLYYEYGPNLYCFRSYDGSQSFVVNSVTHRVESVHIRSEDLLRVKPGMKEISLDEAYVIAENFAKRQYPQLWNTTDKIGLKISKEKLDHGGDYEYLISWIEEYYYPDKNTPGYITIKGLKYIDISISPHGKICSYDEYLTPRDESVSLKPDLTEWQAWDLAKKCVAADNLTLKDSDKKLLALALTTFEEKQRLTWLFDARPENSLNALVGIDAHDGHVVEYSF